MSAFRMQLSLRIGFSTQVFANLLHENIKSAFGRKCANQCLDCLADFPDSGVAVARDERGKVNFGCDDHGGAPPSVASGVPETAAGVSRLGAACPTGWADKP